MNVRPLHDRIIVQRLEEGEQKVGRIIIPDSAKEKPQQGKVIAAGAGKTGRRQASPDVKAGDTILFGKYSGRNQADGERASSCAKTKCSPSSTKPTRKKE
jgi:chaperonin GroES